MIADSPFLDNPQKYLDEFGPVPLWWWSGEKLIVERLTGQLDEMIGAGIRQAVVMNLAPSGPTYGAIADDPAYFSDEWWQIFSAVIEHAALRGFGIWFYDQIGFSGADFQGRLVTAHPELAASRIGREFVDVQAGEREPFELVAPAGAEALAAFVLPLGDDGQVSGPPVRIPLADRTAHFTPAGDSVRVMIAWAQRAGFDYLNPEACAALIDQVHGEFARRLPGHLGTTIRGSFQDELQAMPLWSPAFAEGFAAKSGYDLVDHLPALWEDWGSEARLVRIDYQSTRAALAEAAFFRPLHEWHTSRGMLNGCDQMEPARGGHVGAGVAYYGDYFSTHRWYTAPGSDHWGDARIHDSMARVHGGSRVWIEGFHSTGWGGTLEDTIDWLVPWIIGGANLYNPHAIYYSTAGGYFEWAPPSTCWRQPYWAEYGVFAQTVARLCSAAADGVRLTDIAILYPSTTVMAQQSPTVSAADVFDAVEHPRGDFTLSESDGMLRALLGRMAWRAPETGLLDSAGISSTIVDEQSVIAAAGCDGVLEIGGDEHRMVLLPGVAALGSATARRLIRFVRGGGTLIVLGSVPTLEGGLHDDPVPIHELRTLIEEGHPGVRSYTTVADFGDDLGSVPAAVRSTVPTMLRQSSTGALRLLVPAAPSQASRPRAGSTDLIEGFVLDRARYAQQRPVSVAGNYRVFARDPATGARHLLGSHSSDGRTSFDVHFDKAPIAMLELEPVDVAFEGIADTSPARTMHELPSVGWRLQAVPVVVDRWNDLGSDDGILVPRALRYEAARPDGSWETKRVGFETTGLVRSTPGGAWLRVASSPAVGPGPEPGTRVTRFGTGGTVPESFWSLGSVAQGEEVEAVATFDIQVASESGRYVLRVGAQAITWAWVDGRECIVESSAYYSVAELALEPGLHSLRIRFRSAIDQALDVSWAVLPLELDIQRPQWIIGAEGTLASLEFAIREPLEGRVLFGCLGRATLRVNGSVVARSGEFHNYEAYGFPSVHNHDIGELLVPGSNRFEISFTAPSTVVLVDAIVGMDRVSSGPHWQGATESTYMPYDPTTLRIAPLAQTIPLGTHSAPGLAMIVPLAGPPSWRVRVPPGCHRILVDGEILAEYPTPPAAGTWQHFDRAHPSSAIRFELTSGPGNLLPWHELGLADFAGAVDYVLRFDEKRSGDQITLDLGDVRGTAHAWLNDIDLGSRLWAPWRFDASSSFSSGPNELRVRVTNTLAGHFASINPRAMALPGEERAGLFGPVTLSTGDESATPAQPEWKSK